MKEFDCSRPRALGDSKRTWREGKTTSVAHLSEVLRNPRSFRTRRYVKDYSTIDLCFRVGEKRKSQSNGKLNSVECNPPIAQTDGCRDTVGTLHVPKECQLNVKRGHRLLFGD